MKDRMFTTDFTKPFMDELVAFIEREHLGRGHGLERLAVVFGGKRPAHFLKRALARRIGKGFVSPRFFTIDAFMDEIANVTGARRQAGGLEDCYEIYRLARALTPELLEGREAFSKFLPWAADILGFIGQLDIEDVGEEALENIQQSARIGYAVPGSINRLLMRVLALRRAFHERLQAQGRGARGLQYLRARENVAAWDSGGYDTIIFANFFYFHKTEEAVVRHLLDARKAVLMFQGDQAKWPVLERIARRFGCALKEGRVPTPTTFALKVYSAADVHAQAAAVRDILAGIKDRDRTVVVLPDPGALAPLLSALPVDVRELNVSMGYPLKRSSLCLFLDVLFQAHISRRDGRYYARSYLALMQHPFVKGLRLSDDPQAMDVLAGRIGDMLKGRVTGGISGCTFIAPEEVEAESALFVHPGQGAALEPVLQQAHQLLLRAWDGVSDLRTFALTLGHLLEVLAAKSSLEQHPLNITIAGRIGELLQEFSGASFSGENFALEEIFRIFEDRVSTEMVRFSGTPLRGLQVLGLEETRALNFEHVIIMDVNEGVLPDIDARASLIPREVMAQLSLDRLELEEEIQRYQFMRLISSARDVHLVYQKSREKEPSRFVEELVWEAQQRAGELAPFPTQHCGFALGGSSGARTAIKTPQILQFLRDFTYSASSINAYLSNPYTFYTTYVLGLREDEDLLDEPDAMMIGDFMHRFLEELYKPFEGGALLVDEAFEQRMTAVFERRFAETFGRRMRSDAFLVRAVMEHKLRAFISMERERAPGIARIVALERDFCGSIPLSFGNVRFKARIDRIEECREGGLLVLDYKTGGSDVLPRRPLLLSDAPGRQEIFDNVRSFQLPLYMYFVAQAFDEERLNAGLYSLQDARVNLLFTDKFPPQEAGVFLKPFLAGMDRLMAEILDPAIPFVDDELKKFDF